MYSIDVGAWIRNPIVLFSWLSAVCAWSSGCARDGGADSNDTDAPSDVTDRDVDGGSDVAGADSVDAVLDDADEDDSEDEDSHTPVCEFGYDPFGVCCDDRIFEVVGAERVPVAESAIFMRFSQCPCDPALPVQRGWYCADALLSQAMACDDFGDARRWVQGSVERSDFDGPPLECTWELLAAHTGVYTDEGL